MQHIENINTSINIPAYDSVGDGLVIKLNLTALINGDRSIRAIGNIAVALKYNFQRVVEIIASTKKAWQFFENCTYILECENNNFIVKDSKSSSMAISIALLNIYRAILNKPQMLNISGTGILRIDGTFENAHYETKKHQATLKNNDELKYFITASECNHLYELDKFMC